MVAGVTGIGVVALGGFVPMVFGVFSLVSRRVIAMFHFTLAESSRGLRVTRGLTNLTSQSVPVDRIQGVRLCQPVLWKPFGWWRVDVDIVGYGTERPRGQLRRGDQRAAARRDARARCASP